MAGPGGGSRGGGFSGGSRGGGFGGPGHGGFHRPHHHHHHHFHRPFFGFYRPYYGYGGGCLGGFFGMMFAPVIILIISVMMILSVFGSFGSAFSNVISGGQHYYDEDVIRDYGNEHYYAEFGDSSNAEDNILLIFFINEERDGYDTIAWVGDDVPTDVYLMFGAEGTEYYYHVKNNILNDYEYSLSKNLATVIDKMADEITNKGLAYDNTSDASSHVTNYTDLTINKNTINTALENFTAETNIPIVIVIDNVESVYDKTITFDDIITVIIALVFIGVAIYLIVRGVKTIKKNDNDGDDNGDKNDNSKDNSTSW